jgi:hypothetical protein
MQRFLDLFISIICATCFRRIFLTGQYLTLYVQLCALDDGRRNRLKHVEQIIEINRSRKRCILLVVLLIYTCDARTYESQIFPLRTGQYSNRKKVSAETGLHVICD